MCTVSFIPLKNKVFLTSNRDEKFRRLPATPPMRYSQGSCEMIFPKDGDAGGSWINACNNGNAGVLLNGAFANHKKNENYLKSRGLIFLEIMSSEIPLQEFLSASLFGIEPFTLILWQRNNLYECRLDDKLIKHCRYLPKDCAYIWSSATLYEKEVREKRQASFAEWLTEHPFPSQDEILCFHRFAGSDDKKNSDFIYRNKNVFTVSTTIMDLTIKRARMKHIDFIMGNTTETNLLFF